MSNDSKKKFIDNYIRNIPQILSHQIVADTETPVSTLLKISKNEKYSFLLESVEGGDQRGRYSLLGCDPDLIWRVKASQLIFIFSKIYRSFASYTAISLCK